MGFFLRCLPVLSLVTLVVSQSSAAPIPRPEHPFPQAQRAEWLSLNGTWEFAETDANGDATYLTDTPYPDQIIVPYCRESRLSGLARKGFVKNVWYRRSFEVPKTWKSPRAILHIGACDYRTRVWVNGTLLGEHIGGSAPISFEITKQLRAGPNTVVISAYDDVRTGLQAGGKQSPELESFGCMYTRTTGIWQTVWLEGVGSSYTRDFDITLDPANSRILVKPQLDGPDLGTELAISVFAGSKVVGRARIPASWRNGPAVVNLSEKHLWSVENPFLYGLRLDLMRGNRVIDSVQSYFGLRDVAIRGTAILINGKPVFQRLVLDQGFYPDGIWTARTDDDLKQDIERSKVLGFNGARLHQKVFEPRFLYWADKLGYLVWGEFPNWGLNYSDHAIDLPVVDEWAEILRRDRNHPSIVGWCPFNETGANAGELQNTVVRLTRLVDPSRPVIDTSGYIHSIPDAEVLDAHDYDQNPDSFRSRWCDSFGPDTATPQRYAGAGYSAVPFMVSEYGGIGWNTIDGWGYGVAPKDLDEFYARYEGLTNALLDSRYMFGFCYTQLTDVEQERNGMYTYERVLKFDANRIRDINSRQAACEKNPALQPPSTPDADTWRVLVGAVQDKGLAKQWQYTTDKPGTDWMKPGYDDSSWRTGMGAFGSKGSTWEWAIHTPWTGSDIWMRQSFDYDGSPFDRAVLVTHYDNATEVYLNGVLLWRGQGWNDRYDGFTVTSQARAAAKTGANVIAIHCHQEWGGQYIDAALLVRSL